MFSRLGCGTHPAVFERGKLVYRCPQMCCYKDQLLSEVICDLYTLESMASFEIDAYVLFFASSKTGLVTTAWDRLYFFTQGGNLMCQPRGAVAGGMVLDLDNSSVMAVDCEDRRYCFQITSPSGKTYVIFSPCPAMAVIEKRV